MSDRRKKPPSYPHPADTGVLSSEDKEEPSLKSVIAMMGTMYNRMGHFKQRLYGMTTDASSS